MVMRGLVILTSYPWKWSVLIRWWPGPTIWWPCWSAPPIAPLIATLTVKNVLLSTRIKGNDDLVKKIVIMVVNMNNFKCFVNKESLNKMESWDETLWRHGLLSADKIIAAWDVTLWFSAASSPPSSSWPWQNRFVRQVLSGGIADLTLLEQSEKAP